MHFLAILDFGVGFDLASEGDDTSSATFGYLVLFGFSAGTDGMWRFRSRRHRVIRLNRRSKNGLWLLPRSAQMGWYDAKLRRVMICRAATHGFSRIGSCGLDCRHYWQGKAHRTLDFLADNPHFTRSALPVIGRRCRSKTIAERSGRIEAGLAHGQGAGQACIWKPSSSAPACLHRR